jgi:cystathionine gamma-lyase
MGLSEESARRAARLLHHRKSGLAPGESVTPPIVPGTTFHLPHNGTAGYFYSRAGTPTWSELEAQLAILEDAETVAFPSGMAAISAAFFACLKAGDRVILPSDGYYVTRVLAQDFLQGLGVAVTSLPTSAYDTADFAGAALVYVETPSNPGLDVCDIRSVVARARAAGARVVVDNTTMTPFLQRPLDLGADLVVAADTKAPGGHSDLLAGHVAGRDAALVARVRDWRRVSGAVLGPFEAWLLHRGLETLELRLERMCASAQVIAERLAGHRAVQGLRFPGLAGDPSHSAIGAQMANGGFLIGLTLGSHDEAERFLSACPYLAQSTSFGATHSSAERRARWGDAVPDGFIRLSVGVEPVEVLWSAIDSALAG